MAPAAPRVTFAMQRYLFPCMVLAVALLAAASLFIGVSEVSVLDVLTGRADAAALEILAVSRLPRTLSLLLAGAAMAVAGLLMQMLARNRFVEPSTAGTVESASLGLLVVLILSLIHI